MPDAATTRETVLVVEDDPDITEILSLYLGGGGYAVRTACDGLSGLDELRAGGVSVVLADVMMPRMNGYDFVRAVREFSSVPVIFVSARTQAADRIVGLDAGADGYVTKPFDPMEVLAYVRAVLRRATVGAAAGSSGTLCVRDLVLDANRLVLRKAGQVVPLTAAELKMMLCLMRAPGRIFTKAQLHEAVTGEVGIGAEESVVVHVSNIRAKIGDSDPSAPYIKTVRGLGYRLEA